MYHIVSRIREEGNNLSELWSIDCGEIDDIGEALVAVAGGNPKILIYKWSKAAPLSFHLHVTLEGHVLGVCHVRLNKDSTHLLSSSMDGWTILWDLSTNTQIHKFESQISTHTPSQFSQNNNVIVSNDSENQLEFFSLENLSEVVNRIKLTKISSYFCVSPDNNLIAVGYVDGHVEIYTLSDPSVVKFVISGCHTVKSIAFDSDSKNLVIGDTSGAIRFYDIYDDRMLHFLGHQAAVVDGIVVESIGFSSLDRTMRIWDVLSGCSEIFLDHSNQIWDFASLHEDEFMFAVDDQNSVLILKSSGP